jgi:hypothetical protein
MTVASPPEDPEAILALMGGWSHEALAAVRSGIEAMLAQPASVPPPTVPRVPGVTLRHEYVQCGKKGCNRCPHGPYWYAYWRDGKRLRKRYVGKHLPEDLSVLQKPA